MVPASSVPGVTQVKNRCDLFFQKKTQLKNLKNIMGVHKYSVNDAVRADLVISGLLTSTNFW